MLGWVLKNKEWFLNGVGVTIMKWISKLFSVNKELAPTTNINQIVNIGNGRKEVNLSTPIHNRSKGSLQILFIDDNKVSFIPAMRKAGYSLISWQKDISNVQCRKIIDSDIIFVDVNGVGVNLFPQEQGFGLAKAIKTQYPNKCVVLYSAEPQYLKKDYNSLDSVLPKNSEPYEFIKIIDDWNQG